MSVWAIDSKGNVYKDNVYQESKTGVVPESVLSEARKAKAGQPYTQKIEVSSGGGSFSGGGSSGGGSVAPTYGFVNNEPIAGAGANVTSNNDPYNPNYTDYLNNPVSGGGYTDGFMSFLTNLVNRAFGAVDFVFGFVGRYALILLGILALSKFSKVFSLKLKWK